MEAVLKKEIISSKTLTRVMGIVVFIILTSLGAFVRIPLPFTPVPVTLQTFFVLLSGLFLGASLGGVSQASYILLGAWGLPIFTGAACGIIYLLGPTAGYLAGFVVCAMVLGALKARFEQNFMSLFLLLCLGNFIILCSGAIWLKILTRCSLQHAVYIGFLPFIPGDLAKVVLAAGLYSRLKARLKEIF